LRLLEQLAADAAGGGLRPLAEYQAAHPGHEALVERELRDFEQRRADAAGAVGPGAPGGPAHLGPYLLEDVLGRGAQGVVYLALDERLGRRVALKLLTGLAGAGDGRAVALGEVSCARAVAPLEELGAVAASEQPHDAPPGG
jgi:hypothetical protein